MYNACYIIVWIDETDNEIKTYQQVYSSNSSSSVGVRLENDYIKVNRTDTNLGHSVLIKKACKKYTQQSGTYPNPVIDFPTATYTDVSANTSYSSSSYYTLTPQIFVWDE